MSMGEEFEIVVTGFEVDEARAKDGLARVFGLEPAEADTFVASLPRVAKHIAPRQAADRYVKALRAIGARVECLAAQGPTECTVRGRGRERPGIPFFASLPVPASGAPHMHSLHVDDAAERALARFRAAEGLEPPYSLPPIDLLNPQIPKAPLLPHDLAGMPNADLPIWSDPPGWVMTEPADDSWVGPMRPTPSWGGDTDLPVIEHNAVSSASPVTLPAGVNSDASTDSSWLTKDNVTHADVRRSQWFALSRRTGVAAALLALVALALVLAYGSTETATSEGVQLGPRAHASALEWLEAPHRTVLGLGRRDARELAARLARAGAVAVRPLGIEREGNREHALALFVELPEERAARRAVLDQVARARGQTASAGDDRGQQYEILAFR